MFNNMVTLLRASMPFYYRSQNGHPVFGSSVPEVVIIVFAMISGTLLYNLVSVFLITGVMDLKRRYHWVGLNTTSISHSILQDRPFQSSPPTPPPTSLHMTTSLPPPPPPHRTQTVNCTDLIQIVRRQGSDVPQLEMRVPSNIFAWSVSWKR